MKLTRSVYDAIIEHMKKGYPNEACGILAGSGKSAKFYPMRNTDESAISYFMDPKEQLAVFKKMRADGLEMTGIVHSHVASAAYPSQKDVRLAFYPEVSYLIVSLSDADKPVLRSFRIENDKISEEEVRIG
jgi:proteasome lid subunit RPN8/RPN11